MQRRGEAHWERMVRGNYKVRLDILPGSPHGALQCSDEAEELLLVKPESRRYHFGSCAALCRASADNAKWPIPAGELKHG